MLFPSSSRDDTLIAPMMMMMMICNDDGSERGVKDSVNDDDDMSAQCWNPLVVCGPSGVGKGSIISRFMDEMKGSKHFGFTVSHTTRKPRPNEIDGVHYHFTTIEPMKDAIAKGEFLEYAEVHGNLYGTSLEAMKHVHNVLRKHSLLDVDVQGVKAIKDYCAINYPNMSNNNNAGLFVLRPHYVFIAPPSLQILKQRLANRGTESSQSLQRRTSNALAEMDYGMLPGNFDCIVVNDDLDQACEDFHHVVKSFYNH